MKEIRYQVTFIFLDFLSISKPVMGDEGEIEHFCVYAW